MQYGSHALPADNGILCLVPTTDLVLKAIKNRAGPRSTAEVDGDRDHVAGSERALDLGRHLAQTDCGHGLSHVNRPHPVILPNPGGNSAADQYCADHAVPTTPIACKVLDDEFGLLSENAEEAGLAWAGPPMVTRRTVDVGGRDVSALAWGDEPARAVFLHGGAQNAHTWDTVALALGRPMLAVDLPGHGRSGWRPDGDYGVEGMADDVVEVVCRLAPEATMLVGIGLGAPVALLATRRLPSPIERLVVIDSAPGTHPTDGAVRDTDAGTNVAAFTAEHAFASFDEMLDRAQRFNPGRSERSLRRGILHNAHERWPTAHGAGGGIRASDTAATSPSMPPPRR